MIDAQNKLRKLAMPVGVTSKSVNSVLKSFVSSTDIDLSIKYSEYGKIPIRYTGEKTETFKDYLRVRAVP